MAAEEAHHEQRVQSFAEDVVVRLTRLGMTADRADEKPVGGVRVAFAVEELAGCRGRRGQRIRAHGIGGHGIVQQGAYVAEVTSDVGAEACCLSQHAPLRRPGATQLGSAQQAGDGADGVAATQRPVGHIVQERSHLIVRADRRGGQMADPAFRTFRELFGQVQVHPSTLRARGQLDDRGTSEGVPEDQAAGQGIHPYQACPLGRAQPGEDVRAVNGPLEDVQITGAVQNGEQEQFPCRARQGTDPYGKDLLQALGERQHSR